VVGGEGGRLDGMFLRYSGIPALVESTEFGAWIQLVDKTGYK